MKTSLCSSCQAEITWAKTVNGRPCPLDRQPTPEGNVVLQDGIAYVLRQGETPPDGTRRYVSHFATCPNSKSHRKNK